MSIGFNWFKSYRIDEIDYGKYIGIEYNLEYLDGDSTSHSAGNIRKLQNLFEKYFNIEIPSIDTYCISSKEQNLKLIEPKCMFKMCNELLNSGNDLQDMEDRIAWIKELSAEGYYISYDNI